MQISVLHRRGVLLVDALLLLLAIYAASLVAQKPALPFKTEERGDSLVVVLPSRASAALLPAGTVLRSIEQHNVRSVLQAEYIVDHYAIGDLVSITTNVGPATVRLEAFYSTSYLLALAFSGFSFFFFAIFLWIKSPNDPAARLAHWVSLVTALVIAFDWGKAVEGSVYMRMFYTLSYSFAPYFIAKFSQEYPVRLEGWRRTVLSAMLGIAFVLASASSIGLLYLEQQGHYGDFRVYELPTKFMEVFFALGSLYAVANFIHAYRIALEESDRRRIRWVLLGFGFSCTSYVILWLLPKIFGLGVLVSEELVLMTVSVAPFTFAVSVLRYQLFDIDRIANRATVYVTVLAFLIALYVGVVASIAALIQVRATDRLPESINIIAAVLVALLFEPVKRRVQAFVDKRFFKVRYNYGKVLSEYSRKFEEANDLESLHATLGSLCQSVLLIPEWRLRRTESDGEVRMYRAQAVMKKVEEGAACDIVPELEGWTLRVPIRSDRTTCAFLELGPKRSGLRYNIEDIELLNSISALAGAALSRIDLTEDLAEEKMRAERLKELSELKTAFVSAVTHDLKTPLTSIKLFTEMLETAYGPDDKTAREYLGIISGESDRLRALIDNVLDHTRIERGVMNYNFTSIDLNEAVNTVLKRLDYLLTMQGFELKVDRFDGELLISADPALLDSVVTNLISNAMKYSSDEKHVAIATTRNGEEAILTVADRGIGISQVDLPNIFQPFYRCAARSALQASGTGLGLSNVQHIVTAHHGRTSVQSVLGIGTRFTLAFPLLVDHEQDIDH